jgi:serine/threonine protein kinase
MPQTSQRNSASSRPAARVQIRESAPSNAATVGSWELVRLVGEGSMSRVYQARPCGAPADLAACYAVRMLREPWHDHPQALEMLRREAWIGSKIFHPHLVPVLAANLSEAPYFVVMPCLVGRTLAEHLRSGEGFALPVILWIARQVAEALEALHAAGWMHADIKPGNIFLPPEGHVTLIDLGFAQKVREMRSLGERPMMGTLAYIAPEMLTSATAADIRSDIYSLGITLFEMLAGRLPFQAEDMADLALEHRQGVPAELRILVPHLPTRAARLVKQMLAKDPLRRPQTPRELVDRLAALEIETFADRAPLVA